MSRRKNHSSIIRTINSLNKEKGSYQFELVIVGAHDTAYGGKIKLKYSSDTVKFLGKQSKQSIQGLMSQSDVFALLSKVETFGIVYAEALSQGLPVIYTADQGFDGWLNDRTLAIPVRSGNESDFKNALTSMQKRSSINPTAIEFAAKSFDWNIVCKTLSEIYLSITANSRQSN